MGVCGPWQRRQGLGSASSAEEAGTGAGKQHGAGRDGGEVREGLLFRLGLGLLLWAFLYNSWPTGLLFLLLDFEVNMHGYGNT
jgi:hypothetical protein